jgi:hypothetical protein
MGRYTAYRYARQLRLAACPFKNYKQKQIVKEEFFAEEKNQKTFARAPAAPYRPAQAPCRHRQQIKVFWFFSSEKNILNPLLSLPSFRTHSA